MAETEPVHAGVDFQMAAQAVAAAVRGRARRRRARCAADGVEIVGVSANSKTPSRSLMPSAPKTRIGIATPGAAQHDPFFDVRARQHRGARALERQAHLALRRGRRRSP